MAVVLGMTWFLGRNAVNCLRGGMTDPLTMKRKEPTFTTSSMITSYMSAIFELTNLHAELINTRRSGLMQTSFYILCKKS